MNTRMLSMLTVAILASGCSREKVDETAASAAVAANTTPVPEAVAAVLQSGGTPVAKLGFVLVTRPVVGVVSELRLELTSASALPSLQVSTEAEAVTIDPSMARATLSIEAGKIASHLVRITPQREGLTQVTVRLKAGESPEAVYAIPVEVAATAAGG